MSRMKQAGAIFLGWRNGRRGRWATGGQKRWFDSIPEDHDMEVTNDLTC